METTNKMCEQRPRAIGSFYIQHPVMSSRKMLTKKKTAFYFAIDSEIRFLSDDNCKHFQLGFSFTAS